MKLKKNWLRKQFSNQIFQYEWVFQPTFSQLVSFWMEVFTTCQMLNQLFCNASSNQVDMCFSKKINSCCKTRFRINFFLQKYTVNISRMAVYSFLKEKEHEKRTGMANRFWIKKIDTSVSINQLLHNSLVFEWKILQRFRCWINIFTTHKVFQVELCFYQIKFYCKTRIWKIFLQKHTVKFWKMAV